MRDKNIEKAENLNLTLPLQQTEVNSNLSLNKAKFLSKASLREVNTLASCKVYSNNRF